MSELSKAAKDITGRICAHPEHLWRAIAEYSPRYTNHYHAYQAWRKLKYYGIFSKQSNGPDLESAVERVFQFEATLIYGAMRDEGVESNDALSHVSMLIDRLRDAAKTSIQHIVDEGIYIFPNHQG